MIFNYFTDPEDLIIKKELIQPWVGTQNPNSPPKAPFADTQKGWTHSKYKNHPFFESMEELEEWFEKSNKVVGFLTGYDPHDAKMTLAAIDIDGLKDVDEAFMIESRELLYNALSKMNIDFWSEKTATNGKHIFYKSEEKLEHETLDIFEYIYFPKDSKFKDYRIKYPSKDAGSVAVEIFTQLKYVICAPTEFDGNKYEIMHVKTDGKLKSYSESFDYEKFKPVEDIQKEIVEVLLEAGFIFDSEGYEAKLQKDKAQEYNTINVKDFDVNDKFIDVFKKFYTIGHRNEFGWRMISNFRRIGWTKDEVYQFFKSLDVKDHDLKKVRAWINDKYILPINKLAGLHSLNTYIDSIDIFTEETKEQYKNFFREKFRGGAISDILSRLRTLDTEDIKVKKDTAIYRYDPNLYMDSEKKLKHSFLYVKVTDGNKYRYGWSDKQNEVPKNWTKEYTQSPLENGPQRNSKIGFLAEKEKVDRSEDSIKNFIDSIKFNHNTPLALLYINENLQILRNYAIMKETVNQKAGILTIPINDGKNFITNDTIKNRITAKKLVYDKVSHMYELEPAGDIASFAIQGCEFDVDVIGNKNRYKIITSDGKIRPFDTVSQFITESKDTPGVVLNKITFEDTVNRVFESIPLKHGLYASADGIFQKEDKLYYCLKNDIFDVKTPTEEQIKQGKNVLTDIYKYSSFNDKTKLTHLIRWFLLSPFSYIFKQHGKIFPGIYAWGSSDVGKTAIALALAQFWRQIHKKGGTSLNSIPQIGKAFNESGFSLIINESRRLFNSGRLTDDIKHMEFFKTAIEELISREPHKNHSRETEFIHSYCNVYLSANYDPEIIAKSLLKRLIPIMFTDDDLSDDNGELWNKVFNNGERFSQLKYIGDLFFLFAQKNQKLLVDDYDKFYENFIDELFGDSEYADIFKDIKLNQDQISEDEYIRDLVIDELLNERRGLVKEYNIKQKTLNMLEEDNDSNIKYGPNVSKTDELKYLIKEGLINGVVYKPKSTHEECVVIKSSFLKQIRQKTNVENLNTDKLRKIFNSDYSKNVRINGVSVNRIATISFSKLRSLIEVDD